MPGRGEGGNENEKKGTRAVLLFVEYVRGPARPSRRTRFVPSGCCPSGWLCREMFPLLSNRFPACPQSKKRGGRCAPHSLFSDEQTEDEKRTERSVVGSRRGVRVVITYVHTINIFTLFRNYTCTPTFLSLPGYSDASECLNARASTRTRAYRPQDNRVEN